MELTNDTYFSKEATEQFWSVSQFKAFDKCEAAGLADSRGQIDHEPSEALLIGSYVDAYFTGDKGALGKFALEHPEIFNSRTGDLKASFKHAKTMINAVECQPLMMEYLHGEYQQIRTAKLFDVDWKIKMDVFDGNRIVDLKTVKDFKPLYKDGFGYVDWIQFWGYDIQGAIYQKIEQISAERDEPLPFYIVAVTKEKTPDVAIIRLPQHILDTALKVVESKIDRFDLVKTGQIEPRRCEECEWCKSTKILTEPSVYEAEA